MFPSANDRTVPFNGAAALITLLAFGSVAFHVTLIFTGLLPNLLVRPMHLALALPWVFVIGASGSLVSRISGWLLAGAGIAICAYIAWNTEALGDQYGYTEGWLQRAGGILILLIVLEMARRAVAADTPESAYARLFGELRIRPPVDGEGLASRRSREGLAQGSDAVIHRRLAGH